MKDLPEVVLRKNLSFWWTYRDKDGKEISDHKYEPSGQNTLIRAEEATKFPFSSIIKVS